MGRCTANVFQCRRVAAVVFAGAGRDARSCRGVARGGRNAEARQEARGARHGRRASVDRPPVCSWTARGFARSGGTIVSGPVAIPHVESPWLSKNRLRGRPYTQFSSSFSLQLKRERRREFRCRALGCGHFLTAMDFPHVVS